MLTCKKIYTDIPFSHRQPKHDGHCAQIHGHNWDFEIVFACHEVDDNGFVIDFGKLKFIKDYFSKFDHAFVVPEYDSQMQRWEELNKARLVNLVIIPDASAEGMAQYLHNEIDYLVSSHTDGRCWVESLTVHEDKRNSATWEKE